MNDPDASQSDSSNPSNSTQGDILIVDDTLPNLRTLSAMLTEHGYKVRGARDGHTALMIAEGKTPDLILLDIRMLGMDGYQVCQQLKAKSETRDIPVIFISALDEVMDKVKGFEVGGIDYITKPFQLEEVLARVETHLALRNLQKQLEVQNAQLQGQITERKRAERGQREALAEALQATNALQKAHDELEQRVEERTAELAKANASLKAEIAERKQTEEAYHTLVEHSLQGLLIIQGGSIVFANPGVVDLGGYTHQELLSFSQSDLLTVVYHEDQERILENMQNRLAGKPAPPHYELRFTHKGGEVRWVEALASHVEYHNKPATQIACVDITERKQAEEAQAKLEEQLRQSQKLESIGQLAGGIAHDFNNLLVPIIGYAELGQTELSPDSKLYADLQKIETAAKRAADLTRQILAFSRRQVLEVRVFNLNTVISAFQGMLQRLIGEDIEVRILLASTPCQIKADRSQIEQILLNLSVNARDAMPNGGKLIIETDNVFLDEVYIQKHPETQPGSYVMLTVSDTGQGMDTETQKQIFEPFFTTKKKGEGTGLGLAMVFGLVKQHQGHIWVYSEPGQGTTFKIYLPQSEEMAQTAPAAISEPTSVSGVETVLVVEDEPMVSKLVCETLEAYGYTVLEAESPDQGLQIAATYKRPIHLLLTDVIMPDMNGRELYEKLLIIRPDLKVLYMSGYTDNVIVHHGILDEGVNLLQKPFTVRGLAQKIRRVLD